MFSKFAREHNNLEFEISGLKTSMVNALRRTCLNDIKNIGFDVEKCLIKKNTTNLNDEFILHRMSLIPILIPNWQDIDISKFKFSLNVSYNSQKSKNGYVTTDDLKCVRITTEDNVELQEDTSRFFVRDPDPVLITRFPGAVARGSEKPALLVECYLTVGSHQTNASFSPVSVVSAFPLENGNHKFMIESVGLRDPVEIVDTAFNEMITKLRAMKVKLQTSGRVFKGTFDALDFELTGVDHTLGNLIQEYIYDREIDSEKDDVTHISYHQTHPLEHKIILRVGLARKISDFDVYKDIVVAMLSNHIDSLCVDMKRIHDSFVNTQKK